MIGAKHTGYCMVDIIGNEDLMPEEGYAFKPSKRQTKNYETSLTFPLNTTINSRAASRTCELKPPTPIQDPPFRSTKRHRGKLIAEATFATRKKQLEYNQKLKEYRDAVEYDENQMGAAQLAVVQNESKNLENQKLQQTKLLRETYQVQFAEKAARLQAEKDAQKKFEDQLKLEDQKLAAEEIERQKREKQISLERKTEFEAKNAELQKARENRHAREKAEEARLRSESAEIQAREDARKAEDERRRYEKTKLRARVVDAQATALAKQEQHANHIEAVAQSQAQKNDEEAKRKIEEKKKKMEEERHSDWLKLQKERDFLRKNSMKKPFPSNEIEVDADKVEEEKKKTALYQVKKQQQVQMEEKKFREAQEKKEMLEFEKEMLKKTQEDFDKKIQNLQNIVPTELGIKVPRFQVKSHFS